MDTWRTQAYRSEQESIFMIVEWIQGILQMTLVSMAVPWCLHTTVHNLLTSAVFSMAPLYMLIKCVWNTEWLHRKSGRCKPKEAGQDTERRTQNHYIEIFYKLLNLLILIIFICFLGMTDRLWKSVLKMVTLRDCCSCPKLWMIFLKQAS